MTNSAEHPWTNEKLVEALLASPQRPNMFCITGMSDAQAISALPALADILSAGGIWTAVYNPASAAEKESTIHGVIAAITDKAQAIGLPQSVSLALENYDAVRRPSPNVPEAAQGRLRHEVVGDLLSELSSVHPFVLFAVNLGAATAGDLTTLTYLAQNVFSDPIRSLAPELPSDRDVRGALVTFGEVLRTSAHECFDFSDQSANAFRSFLTSDDVLQRIVEATGGDVSRLEDLVTHLPENARSLQWARFSALDEEWQHVLEVFAVAAVPIDPEVARNALALLQRSEFFGRSIKEGLAAGFLRRSISAGETRLWIADDGLAAQILAAMPEERRLSIHSALANAERLNPDRPDLAFIARQFMAAGEAGLALEYVERAAKRFAARGAWDEALALVESAHELSGEFSPNLAELHLDALTSMGHYREALTVAASLNFDDSEAFHVRVGRLLLKVSDFDGATARFKAALKSDDRLVRASALLGLAECDYGLGHLDEVHPQIVNMLNELGGATNRSAADRLIIEGRNLQGRVAIFESRYDDATQIFEQNRILATHWAWDDEIARADANLGVVAMQQRDHAKALSRLKGALDSHGMRGARPRAYGLVNLATIYQRLEEHHHALESCLEALRCARRSGDDVAYGVAAHNLATIYQDLGAFDRGHAIIEHLRQSPEHRTMVSRWSRLVQGYLFFDDARFHEASEIFEELSEDDALLYQPEARLRLAQCYMVAGQRDAAARILENFASDSGDSDLLNALVILIGAELKLDTDPDGALADARAATAKLRDLSQRTDTIQGVIVCAKTLTALGRESDARTLLETELQEVLRRATHVPDEFQRTYFNKPVHRALVEQLRVLRGDVPVAVANAISQDSSVEPAEISSRLEVWHQHYAHMVGESAKLHQVFRLIDRVAKSQAPVLVYGESGTGKELIAEALHEQSDRAGRPFVKVNCAAFVENLLLSELFGHEKGAFTGASAQRIGRFELADGGTIFLDEIGDISPNTQVALLRVLQEGTFERVGGSSMLNVDVRVVCATNKNLEEMVARGEFRLDLYYRLKGVVIESPSLRERREDIPRLLNFFAKRYADGAPKGFETNVLKHLMRYSWPGNIRELQNFVRSIMLFVEGPTVTMADVNAFRDFFISGRFEDVAVEIPADVERTTPVSPTPRAVADGRDPEDVLVDRIVKEGMSLAELKKRLEIESIKRALLEADGNVTRAAELLQMKRPRLSQIINGTEELADLKALLVG